MMQKLIPFRKARNLLFLSLFVFPSPAYPLMIYYTDSAGGGRASQPQPSICSNCGIFFEGPYKSVQVNRNEYRRNIWQDTANEPSIALNPLDPAHVVIVFKHYPQSVPDTQNGGVAVTVDGGLTWNFFVIQPSMDPQVEFFSDPVIVADNNAFYFYGLNRKQSPLDRHGDLWVSVDGGFDWQLRHNPEGISPLPAGKGGDKPWIAVDNTGGIGNGLLYAFWDGAYGDFCCVDSGPLRFARSVDGGFSWSDNIQMFDPDNPQPNWQPIFGNMVVAANSDLWIVGKHSSSDAQFVVSHSGNAPFAPIHEVTFRHHVMNADTWLNGRMATATPSSPYGNYAGSLAGTPWIMTDYENLSSQNIYVLASVNPVNNPDPLDVYFQRGTLNGDGSITWRSNAVRVNDDDPAEENSFQWFGTLCLAPNGRLDAFYYHSPQFDLNLHSTAHLRFTYSLDQGETWSPSIQVSPLFDPRAAYPSAGINWKMGDYIQCVSRNDSTHVAYAATLNGEQDVFYLKFDFPPTRFFRSRF